ncbi:DUF2946 family protein [Luteibacter yeojuensis]|nr:DUF2946 family protein [Luteibacter yeojuensis]
MALVAVWLTAFAPTVSRVSAFTFPDLGAWCEPAATPHHHDGGHAGHDDGDAACGYCTLFTHSPGMAGGVHVGEVPRLAIEGGARAAPAHAFAPPAFFHTRPRGPPVAAHA